MTSRARSQPEDEETFELALDVFGRAVVPEAVAGAEPEDLAVALEAVCFSLNRPVTLAEVAAILGRTPAAVAAAAEALAEQLRGRGLMLQRHGDELQLVTRPETAWAVQRALQPERPTRLSRPALETLAIVAYRQPLTRAGIEAIRGVNCEAVLESLERRGLIAEVDRQDTPGTAAPVRHHPALPADRRARAHRRPAAARRRGTGAAGRRGGGRARRCSHAMSPVAAGARRAAQPLPGAARRRLAARRRRAHRRRPGARQRRRRRRLVPGSTSTATPSTSTARPSRPSCLPRSRWRSTSPPACSPR